MPAELRPTYINGVFELLSQPFVDHRGLFLNAFRANEPAFQNSWGNQDVAQVNFSRTECVGAIRGLHLQAHPHGESKLVRCIKGRVWDVAVDLRRDSSTFGKWLAIELTPKLGNALLIPEGCAHGFQVLKSGSELLYLHSGPWIPEAEIGVRWDSPLLSISWPLKPTELSERDRSLPQFSDISSSI